MDCSAANGSVLVTRITHQDIRVQLCLLQLSPALVGGPGLVASGLDGFGHPPCLHQGIAGPGRRTPRRAPRQGFLRRAQRRAAELRLRGAADLDERGSGGEEQIRREDAEYTEEDLAAGSGPSVRCCKVINATTLRTKFEEVMTRFGGPCAGARGCGRPG